MEEQARVIKKLRIEKRLSQEQLSDDSGVSLRTIQRLENGETLGREKTIHKLANALSVSYDDIHISNTDNKIVKERIPSYKFNIFIWLKILTFIIIGGCMGAITGFYIAKNGELIYVFILLFSAIGAAIAVQHSLKNS